MTSGPSDAYRNDSFYTTANTTGYWTGTGSTYGTTGAESSNKDGANVDMACFGLTLVFIVLSVIGNLYLIRCFFIHLRKKLSNCFIIYINIMIADLMQGLLSMPFSAFVFYKNRHIETDGNLYLTIWCNFSGFVYNTLSRVVIHLVFLLTLDRFIAISRPTFHRNRMTHRVYFIAVVIVWTVDCFVSSLPYIKGVNYIFRPTGLETTCTWSMRVLLKTPGNAMTDPLLTMYFILLNTLPVTFFLFLTVILSIMLLCKLHRQTLSSISAGSNSSKKVYVYASTTILLITLLYFVCYLTWNLILIYTLVQLVAMLISKSPMYSFYSKVPVLRFIFSSSCLGAFANSAINPILLYTRIVRQELNKTNPGGNTISKGLLGVRTAIKRRSTMLTAQLSALSSYRSRPNSRASNGSEKTQRYTYTNIKEEKVEPEDQVEIGTATSTVF